MNIPSVCKSEVDSGIIDYDDDDDVVDDDDDDDNNDEDDDSGK